MYTAQTEWNSPTSFPNLKDHKYIAIDLETRDPGLKSRGSGALIGEGEIVGIAVAVEGWSGYYSFGHLKQNHFEPIYDKLKLEFDALAVSDGKELTIGTPVVDGAKVSATVISDHFRGKKLYSFKKKRRKGYRRKIGHRQELTKIKVEEIKA